MSIHAIGKLPVLLVIVLLLAAGSLPSAAQHSLHPDRDQPGIESLGQSLDAAAESAPPSTTFSVSSQNDAGAAASIDAVLAQATQVATGEYHTCALTTSGGVKCWGHNGDGQLGDGTTTDRTTPVDVSGLASGVAAVAAGRYHTCALMDAVHGGSVKCWGGNWNGQLGDGTITGRLSPVAVSGLASGVVAVAVGAGHTCALTSSSGVKCWGSNDSGQLGDGTTTKRTTPTSVSGLASGVAVVAAGGYHTCALTSSGGVKCWGYNRFGQLGDGTTTGRLTPVAVNGLASGVVSVAVGQYHTCVVTAGSGVKCWGQNTDGRLGDGTTTDRTAPVDVVGLAGRVAAVAAGWYHTCALTTGDGVSCWGWNGSGQLGDGTAASAYTLVAVSGLASGVAAVAAGYAYTCAVTVATQGGGIKCWGDNLYGQLGDGTTDNRVTPVAVSGLASGNAAMDAGGFHTCAVMDAGHGGGIECWGRNWDGQLGDGTTTHRWNHVGVSGLATGAVAIAAGYDYTCALTTGGGLKCWGWNLNGQLGDGTTTDRLTPVAVNGLASGVAAVAAGGSHTCALTAGGGVKCWGGNWNGQLGDGTITGRLTPVAVSGLASGVISVAVGGSHTCALMTNGGVKCWGRNDYGQLGDGTTIDRTNPVAVSGLASGVSAIAASDAHTCALATSGVKCWGFNGGGQLGDGTTTDRTSPVNVSGLASGVRAIAVGGAHTCALMGAAQGGGIKCWGANQYGQLGDGTTIQRLAPVDVSGLTSGAAVTAGNYHTCALITGGNVKCWGWNNFGQLGVNPGWTPVDVVGFGTVPTYTISGRVTDASGHGIPSVTVWAGFPRATTTDANGDYTFTGLPAGTYTIRPDKDPYAFSPASIPVTVPPDKEQNFSAVSITKIQVNQALGNTTNYVAGKDTVVRVMLSDYVRYDPANQQVVVKRDGVYVTTLKPLKPAFPTQTLNFWGKMEDCQDWQQGGYTFESTVNGSQMTKGSSQFYNRRTLRLLAVPVSVGLGAETRTPRDVWKHANQFLRQTYPVAKDGVVYERSLLTLPAGLFNLTSANDRKLLWNSLQLYQPLLCGLPGRPPCYDAIVGVLPYIQLGDLMGWTYGSPVTLVIEPESDAEAEELQATIAHEVGHIVGGLGDEYGHTAGLPNLGGNFQCNINPPPKDYCGRNGTASCGTGATRCPLSPAEAWVGPRPGGGSAVRAQVDSPFEVGGRNALGDKLSFMGGAGVGLENYWVTPSVYDHLFWDLPSSASQVSAASPTTERVANVSGEVGLDGHAILNPAYHLMSAAPSTTTGDYTVELLDAQGALLSSQGFSVSFLGLSNPPQDLSEAPFDVAIRFPVGTRTMRVKHGANILTEMTVSAHAPTLSLTYPGGGQTWAATGNYTIRWQGNDVDGDILHYTVLYRQGTGDWNVLGADLTASELAVNAADLPGGTAASVQVLATDGINTTVVESAPFTVGRKPPEAFITYPAEGAIFMPGVSLFLQGTAYDLEDGALPDSAYRWTSDKDGDLGTGASNLVTLSSGPHVITLTVMDSDGNTAVKTIRLPAGSQQFMPLISRSQ